MFSSETKKDDFATSDEEMLSLHGDSDDENRKRSIVLNPTRDLEDPKFKFAVHMILSNSREFKYAVEVHAVIQKRKSDLKRMKVQGIGQVVRCQATNGFIFAAKVIKMSLSLSRQ